MATDKPRVDYERHTLRGFPRRVVRAFVLGVLRIIAKVRIEEIERVPKTGAMLVVSNHLHNADPIILIAAFPRSVHYMAKKEIFVPVVGTLVRLVGTFPVDRGRADRTAIKRAQATLAQGVPVGIFPEGTRSVTRSLQKAHPGAGLLALSGAPVQPVVITGSERLPFNGSKAKAASHLPWPDSGHNGVRVLYGEPFVIPKSIDGRRVGADEATEIIMVELARMLPPDYRGVYAEALANETTRRALPFTAG
jgi:1-acyl-sn-glycerol-3-phosphate acyltransferase